MDFLTNWHHLDFMYFNHSKVRIQTQKQYTGIWQCIVTTFSKEGVGDVCMDKNVIVVPYDP